MENDRREDLQNMLRSDGWKVFLEEIVYPQMEVATMRLKNLRFDSSLGVNEGPVAAAELRALEKVVNDAREAAFEGG